MDSKAFHNLSYGLFLISARDANGKNTGCVVNTFQQVSSEPPMASVALHKNNLTTEVVRAAGKFGATVITESADMPFIGKFGFRSGRDTEKFTDIQFKLDADEIAYVTEHTNARFCVRVMHMLDLGSHYLFVGEVEDAEVLSDEPSMTYDFYHNELKGKSPKNAVSYKGE